MGRKSRSKKDAAAERPAAAATTTSQQASEAATGPRSAWRNVIVAAGTLLVLLFAVYWQVHGHEFINYDDTLYVTQNDHVKAGLSAANVGWAFTTFTASNWHPLTWISLMLDASLFGLNAGAFALMNVALHAIASVLLLLFLWRATGSTWKSSVVTALFALHPLRVESVAWIAERKDVLSTLFFFATLLAWGEWGRRKSRGAYVLALILFALGLLAKPMLVTLPLVLLLADVWPLRRVDLANPGFAMIRPLVVEKLPFFALLVPSILLTLKAQSGAMTATLPLSTRIANACIAYVAYVWKLVWPTKLAVFYPIDTHPSFALAAIAFVLLAAVTFTAIRFARALPWLPVGWFWYLGTLVPVIGILQVGRQAMADRYSYIPSVGLLVMLVWGIAAIVAVHRQLRVAAIGAACLAIAGCSLITARQAGFWKDSYTLFTHTLAVTDHNYVAHTNLGAAYIDQMRFTQAEAEYRKALELSPGETPAMIGLGNALRMRGDLDGAAVQFRRALKTDPSNQNVYRSLADIELARGNTKDAVELLQKATTHNNDPQALAVLAAAQGRNEEAIAHYRDAIAANPASAILHNDFAALLARTGHDDEAMTEYQKSIELGPDFFDARMNYAAILSRHGRDPEAIEQLQKAASLRPHSPEPHVYLGLIYSMSGKAAEAAGEMSAAVTIDHDVANQQFTSALKIPPGPKNIDEYIQFLKQQPAAGR